MGHVGLVLGLEMSRLARAGRDWHQLIELCSLAGAHRSRMKFLDLPTRLLRDHPLAHALCCGPGCHEFSRERSQSSGMPNTCRNRGARVVHACVCAGQRTLECGQPCCLQNGCSAC